ncbi:MAG: hypothetical protein E6F99_23700 [Actinobacteria bacterium]|nr:MAG: hypothetical protein E6F99_23700 [Actinomycetota bacterium]
MVPGVAHSLRVNGTARIVADAEFFDEMAVYGRRPPLALLVTVTECYFHCGKALVRSQLWEPDTWPAPGTVPTLGAALRDAAALSDDEVAARGRGRPADLRSRLSRHGVAAEPRGEERDYLDRNT